MTLPFSLLLVVLSFVLTSSHNKMDSPDDVQIFYYAWFGTPDHDGKWMHWNHEVLPHWDQNLRGNFPYGRMLSPPGGIGSVYYPKRGLYSSKDASILKAQFSEIAAVGVGVIILSWWRKGWGSEQVAR